MCPSFSLSIANRMSELPRATQAAGEFLRQQGVSRDVIATVDLALDELLANIVKWGYADSGEHRIQVTGAIDTTHMHMAIEDDGRPFDPTAAPEPDLNAPLERRREGGLGIHLVRTLVDEIHYERHGAQNCLRLKVALAPPSG